MFVCSPGPSAVGYKAQALRLDVGLSTHYEVEWWNIMQGRMVFFNTFLVW